RRHTRSDRDWSSDVCSSDLGHLVDPDLSRKRASLSEDREEQEEDHLAVSLAEDEPFELGMDLREHARAHALEVGHGPVVREDPRSEERRVGKEWRSEGRTGA